MGIYQHSYIFYGCSIPLEIGKTISLTDNDAIVLDSAAFLNILRIKKSDWVISDENDQAQGYVKLSEIISVYKSVLDNRGVILTKEEEDIVFNKSEFIPTKEEEDIFLNKLNSLVEFDNQRKVQLYLLEYNVCTLEFPHSVDFVRILPIDVDK